MNDATENDESTAGEADIDSPIPALLQVQLTFDLGSCSTPLSDIQSWQVGAVVPRDNALSTPTAKVTIRANGNAIGEGDLVQIDDRMAVRLNRLLINS